MKKLLIIALALAFLLSGCSVAASQQASAAPTTAVAAATATIEATATVAAATATPEATATATVEPTQSPTPEPTATPAPTVPSSFQTAEINIKNVESAITSLFKEGEYVGTSTEDSAGNIFVTVYFKPLNYTDEKDFVQQASHQAAVVMEVLFTNQTINEVFFIADADLKNADGNAESTDVEKINVTKEKAANIDWAQMKQSTDYTTILKAADTYEIIPAFADKLK